MQIGRDSDWNSTLLKQPISRHCRIPLQWGPWGWQLMDQTGHQCQGLWEAMGSETFLVVEFWSYKTQTWDGGDGSVRRRIYLILQKQSLKLVMMVKGKWKWKSLSRVRLFVTRILQTRILESVAFPFSRGSFQPRGQSQVFHIAGGFFTGWATREAPKG